MNFFTLTEDIGAHHFENFLIWVTLLSTLGFRTWLAGILTAVPYTFRIAREGKKKLLLYVTSSKLRQNNKKNQLQSKLRMKTPWKY